MFASISIVDIANLIEYAHLDGIDTDTFVCENNLFEWMKQAYRTEGSLLLEKQLKWKVSSDQEGIAPPYKNLSIVHACCFSIMFLWLVDHTWL